MLGVVGVTLPFKYDKYFVSRHRRQVLRSGGVSDSDRGSTSNLRGEGQVSIT